MDEDLSALIDGDDFVSAEQQREAEAQRRREARRKRLQHVQADSGGGADVAFPQPSRKRERTSEAAAVDNKEPSPTTMDQTVTAVYDMFSGDPSPEQAALTTATTTQRGHGQEDWDDSDGYYQAVIGEEIRWNDLVVRVDGLIGKGVFSTVLKCTTVQSESDLPSVVALKFVRHNETMEKAADLEVQSLQKLNGSPGIVPLLLPQARAKLDYRGHVILVFPYMECNLRDVLHKFGKGVGLSLPAVRSYFQQLLSALTHLETHGIIHADLKPDNILVDGANFSRVYIADFGSVIDGSHPPTPYLVSRYYRAPEIVLGLTPTSAIDLWSLAVTVAELFLGSVLFPGKSNNDMLYVWMQHLGALSNRLIRQHLAQCSRYPDVVQQFAGSGGGNYVFWQQTHDPVTGEAVRRDLPLVVGATRRGFPSATPLVPKLLKAKSADDSRATVQQFGDLLTQCLAFDPSRRIGLPAALQHAFFG